VKTILVVEDEMKIARLVRDYLLHAGFDVVVSGDGESGLASARGVKPDLIVLDLGLPGRDGLDVTRELRRTSNVPIVMLTARGDEADRVVGLELGADDYLVKPFSPKELLARIRAVLRRTDVARAAGPEVLRASDVEVDVPRMRVAVAGRRIDLTATEFQLLVTLVREPGRVFTRAQLLDAVHGVALESYERGHRRAREEHQEEGRTDARAAALPPHRLRRRLPVRRWVIAVRPGGRRASRSRRQATDRGAGVAGDSPARWAW
jgi:two-component system alkaline phosphatase synthesis response regulator PhoP